jgi:two-component system, chemotaxis family, protein-glutamate methylesterase/glutaminase
MTTVEQRVVAVGASAGGVDALTRFVSALPPDLPAAVLVALHLTPSSPSLLPRVLARRSPLEVLPAEDGLPLRNGQVVVSVPDCHLLVVEGRVVLGRGARENGHRPSHDAMLRSVALAAGPRAVGLVLTGLLDDGSAGLRCVDRYGGTCLVQDPDDAEYPDMPRNALRSVPGARAATIPVLVKEVVSAMSHDPHPAPDVDQVQRQLDQAELASALGQPTKLPDGSVPGQPSAFACPDCHGVLNGIPDGEVQRFRCRTGHAWTESSLLAQQGNQVEEALWTALRALEEKADMSRRMAERAEEEGRPWSGAHHREREEEAMRSASTLRDVLGQSIAEPAAPAAEG